MGQTICMSSTVLEMRNLFNSGKGLPCMVKTAFVRQWYSVTQCIKFEVRTTVQVTGVEQLF